MLPQAQAQIQRAQGQIVTHADLVEAQRQWQRQPLTFPSAWQAPVSEPLASVQRALAKARAEEKRLIQALAVLDGAATVAPSVPPAS